jgi:hypothetical protein
MSDVANLDRAASGGASAGAAVGGVVVTHEDIKVMYGVSTTKADWSCEINRAHAIIQEAYGLDI